MTIEIASERETELVLALAKAESINAELLDALKWCVNHLEMIAKRDYPDSEESMRRFNSTAAGLYAIAKAEGTL